MQFAPLILNAALDSMEPFFQTIDIRTGPAPADCAAASTGTLLATITLPGDPFTNAANGIKSKQGTWAGTGLAAGTAGHFRAYQGAVCVAQGTVTLLAGDGDMKMDNTNIAATQQLNVGSFTLNAGGV